MSGLFTRVRKLRRAVGQAQRLRVILSVFLKYGYEDLIHRLPLHGLWRSLGGRHFRRERAALAELPLPVKLRLAFQELGPAFVKLGQLLAGRRHLLPRAYLDELAQLNDRVPPVPFAQVQEVLLKELGEVRMAEIVEIDPQPLGSASIAQVHAARLKDGTEVVLKVQRPEVSRIIHLDLAIMGHLAGLIEKHLDEWQVHQPSAIVAEFAHRMELELDFSAEVAAMERFSKQFEGVAFVYVPKVFRSHCTRRVLMMERIQGVPASQVEALEKAGLDRSELARRLVQVTLEQMFTHGFFHADPHPGNVHVLPGNVVCFLDFGMTGYLTHETRENLAALMIAVARHDEESAKQALLRLGGAELDAPRVGLEGDLAEFIYRHFGSGTGDLVFARLLQHLFRLTSRHALTLPPEVFTVVKALGQLESLIHILDPRIDLLFELSPFLRDMQTARVKPRRILRELVDFSGEALTMLKTMPLEIRRITALLRSGRSRITFRVEGLSPLNDTLDRVANRLAFAVVLAAILVASAIVIHAGIAPLWHGIPVIGLVGYASACFMGVLLLVAILRHGRM